MIKTPIRNQSNWGFRRLIYVKYKLTMIENKEKNALISWYLWIAAFFNINWIFLLDQLTIYERFDH